MTTQKSDIIKTKDDSNQSYISNDCLPATILKQTENVLSSFDVAVSIDTNINKRPFVKVLEYRSETCEDAFGNANQNAAVTLCLRHVRERFESLNDSHQKRLADPIKSISKG
jgi:hypothetical protein